MFLTGQVIHLSLKEQFLTKDQTEGKKPQKQAKSEDGSSTGLAEMFLGRTLEPISTGVFT